MLVQTRDQRHTFSLHRHPSSSNLAHIIILLHMLSLPAELIEEIVYYLAADRPSSLAVALTCKTFSRFRQCVLHTARVKRPAQAVRLITILDSPSSQLHNFVRKLKVEYDSPLVPQILARLPGLRELSLRRALPLTSWTVHHPHDLREMEKLTLRACTFSDGPHLRAFIARFPALRSLRLRAVRLRHRTHLGDYQDALPTGIINLSLAQTGLSIFRDWRPAFPVSVSISLHGNPSDAAYSGLIRTLGSQLSTLNIKMPSIYEPDPADSGYTCASTPFVPL